MLAVLSLNTISSLISKALSDGSISDEEYSLILLEFETFARMKEDLREKSQTSLEKTGNIETEANELLRWNNIGVSTWVRVRNRVRNRVKNHIQSRVRKIKKTANKNISFLKITDPKKRDFIVNESLKRRHPTKLFIRTCRWLEDTIRTFKALQTSYGHAKKI